MKGILKLSYKLLVNDKAKFLALLVGIAFAVFLMMFITSMFYGVLAHSSATVINVGAPVWVMDPSVETPANTIGMPDHVLDAVRSMPEVKYAVPLYSGAALVKLPDGTYQSAMVIGLDDSSLVGRPELIEGNIDNIYAENGFIAVDDVDFPKLGNPHIGSELELNDHRCVIVGIAKVSTSTLFGLPTLYTTYQRAIQYIPNPRYTISYVLVQPKSPHDIDEIKRQVHALGYVALTKNEFIRRTVSYYVYHTGVGMNMLIMTVISFIVGLSISGQTFYTFILENLERFGALKAIGTKGRDLIAMILFQAAFTSLAGYGLGIGLCTALIGFAKLKIPEYFGMITYVNLILPFVMVLIITVVSSYFGVRRVLRIEPFEIFRG
ncbi:MAG TPA: ABC transporter permease [Candidatus Acidoferrales bacterium]|nr:ABC transporter permease [Candidatus Acidoferrales bacterium]